MVSKIIEAKITQKMSAALSANALKPFKYLSNTI